MALRLNGQTTGYTELNAPANGDSVVLTMPGNDGNAGQYLQTNGSGALTWATPTDTTTNLTRGTEVATTSGTEVIYDNLPSGIRRLQIVVNNVSINATANALRFVMRTGSGTNVSSGYYSVCGHQSNGGGYGTYTVTDSFNMWLNVAAERVSGIATFMNVGDNKWVYSGCGAFFSGFIQNAGGYVDLGALLTGIRITTGTGGTFDSGSVNIFYEV